MSDIVLDQFTEDAAEGYVDYLRKFKDSMDRIIEKMNNLAANIDQKSENTFTKAYKSYIDQIAASVNEATNVTQEVIVDCVGELSNNTWNDLTQEEYLKQIGSAANSLDDVQPYKEPELILGAKNPFTLETTEKLFVDFTSAGTEWEEVLYELKNDASNLADNPLQDDMTNVFEKISNQLNIIIEDIKETLDIVAARSMTIVEKKITSKAQNENNAEEKAQEAMQQFQHKMEDAMSLIDGLELD